MPKIPDVPDIAPGGRTKVPGTFKNRILGLAELNHNDIPEVGKHFVVWGSKLLDDVQPRPVTRTAYVSERVYAGHMREVAERLVKEGIKDPLHRGKGRADRAEDYARWRYKGYVCGEVASL